MTRSQAPSRLSLADLPEWAQRQAAEQIGAQPKPICTGCLGTGIIPRFDGGDTKCRSCGGTGEQRAKPRKYRNVPTTFTSRQGFTVKADSKLEARMFAALDQLIVAGQVIWWEPHVRFRLPDDVYECDALVVSKTGIRLLDAKGTVTATFKRKARLMQKYRGIAVEIWR